MISIYFVGILPVEVLKECLNLSVIFLIICGTLFVSRGIFSLVATGFISSPIMYHFLADEPTASRMTALIIMGLIGTIVTDFLMERRRPWFHRAYWVPAYPVYLISAFSFNFAIADRWPQSEWTGIIMTFGTMVVFVIFIGIRQMMFGSEPDVKAD